MMAALPPAALPRIGSLLRLLGSDQDGEALGAARAIGRVLAGFGLTLHDLAAAVERLAASTERETPAKPRRQTRARAGDVVLDYAERRSVVEALRRGLARGRLSEWEHEFAASIVGQLQGGRGRLSERRAEALGRVLDKVGEAVPWA